MKKKIYITTPIFYPNNIPHIGHAYTTISADTLARFYRANDIDVFFTSGTDEHGLKMQKTSKKYGLTPLELANKNTIFFQKMLFQLQISNNDFVRTTEERHKKACISIWKTIKNNGDIYIGNYSGWYSISQESFYEEKDTEIGHDGIRIDKEIGSPVEWRQEESYFFRLSSYQEKLLDFYQTNPDFISPSERYNEIISFVSSGLKDLSISRKTCTWGIPVPENSDHVIYVWMDALVNYLTALGFPELETKWNYWPVNIHIIGKDIIRFHCIYWPAFLMSANIKVPKKIFAHGFILNQQKKISKSLGNSTNIFKIIQDFGSDQIRYFLIREIPFGKDGSYDYEKILQRINSDLSNNFGNLIQRSLKMVENDCENKIPIPYVFFEKDRLLFKKTNQLLFIVCKYMKNISPNYALEEIFHVISDINVYFSREEPWFLKKKNRRRFETVLYITLEMLRRISIVLLPFIPESANKILDLLVVDKKKRMFKHFNQDKIQSGIKLKNLKIIFPRYDKKNS